MMSFSTLLSRAAAVSVLVAAATAATPAVAGSASGTITVSLNVTSACLVNGAANIVSGFGSGGTIQFAEQPGQFGDVYAQLQASAGGSLAVLCSPGTTPSLTIGSGAHDNSGQRYLTAGTTSIPYHLYSDAARTAEVAIGGAIPLGTAATSAINVPLYARVNSGGQVLPAGQYSDTVQVTLAW